MLCSPFAISWGSSKEQGGRYGGAGGSYITTGCVTPLLSIQLLLELCPWSEVFEGSKWSPFHTAAEPNRSLLLGPSFHPLLNSVGREEGGLNGSGVHSLGSGAVWKQEVLPELCWKTGELAYHTVKGGVTTSPSLPCRIFPFFFMFNGGMNIGMGPINIGKQFQIVNSKKWHLSNWFEGVISILS